MKLELKHLECYLSKGLRMLGENIEYELNGSMLDEWFNWGCPTKDKPLVRPLSDLYKEIEYNGERFVPIKRIAKTVYDKNNESVFDDENLYKVIDNKYCYPSNNERTSHWWISFNEKSIGFDNQEIEWFLPQYELINKLLEWHFWIFNQSAFEDGTVIDLKTLKQ